MRSPFGIKTAKQKSVVIVLCPPKHLSVVFCNMCCPRVSSRSGIMAYSAPVTVPCCSNCACGCRALNCLWLNRPPLRPHQNEVVGAPPVANPCSTSQGLNRKGVVRHRPDFPSRPPSHLLVPDLGPASKVSYFLLSDPDNSR